MFFFTSTSFFFYNVFHIPGCDEEGVGNGLCDDVFNRPECDFDGGDCCLPTINEFHCLKCVCLNEETYTTIKPWWLTSTQPPIECELNHYLFLEFDDIGDGICNDYLNHKACNFDGGDCCFGIKGLECSRCECRNENTGFPLLTTTIPSMQCHFDELGLGNGICDAMAFNFECHYDDGDCEGKKWCESY